MSEAAHSEALSQRTVRWRFRCYPTEEQVTGMAQLFGCCRYVFNFGLEARSKAWAERKESLSYKDTSALLTKLKKAEGTQWLGHVSCVPLQQALRDLDKAYKAFWRKGRNKASFPRFKRRENRQSAEFTKSAFTWRTDDPNRPVLSLAKLGKLKIKWSRDMRTAQPTTVTLIKEPSGAYYVSMVLKVPALQATPATAAVGIDMGLTHLAVLSNGTKVPNPRFLQKSLKRLADAQRILSRRTKGSGRWHRARIKVAKLQERVGRLRKDALHKLSKELAAGYDLIAIEDLNVKGMVRNRKLARSICDASWGELRRQLTYKCDWMGRQLVVVDRFLPSSKTCSCCGYKLRDLPLSVREWDCPECGAHHDRDVNAAKNTLAAGLAVSARGAEVRPKAA